MQVFRWSLDILCALKHLHGLDPIVMHRDLKPANILLARNHRTLKLADFGLAKRICRTEPGGKRRRHTCNVGTPQYGAPEVFAIPLAAADAGVYTEKADIYSAALIIWYLLTGRVPSTSVIAEPRARPDIGPAARRWPGMAELVERMWVHDPEARPSAAECAAVVRGLPLRAGLCGVGAACRMLQNAVIRASHSISSKPTPWPLKTASHLMTP